jgi:hypothetical protein
MNKNLADITLVVDRSGSMGECKVEAEKGINAFIAEQKELPGEALFSILQFDNTSEWVFQGKPVKEVGHYKLEPRGMTALLDAVGRAIKSTGQRLEAMPEADRPGLVIIAIVTDGLENISSEFTRDNIRKMIELQTNTYNWKFTYLGANQDAFAEAGSIGIPMGGAATYTTSNSTLMYTAMGSQISTMRCMASSGKDASFEYTEEDRKNINT